MSDERDSPVDRPATCRTGKVLKADSIGKADCTYRKQWVHFLFSL